MTVITQTGYFEKKKLLESGHSHFIVHQLYADYAVDVHK